MSEKITVSDPFRTKQKSNPKIAEALKTLGLKDKVNYNHKPTGMKIQFRWSELPKARRENLLQRAIGDEGYYWGQEASDSYAGCNSKGSTLLKVWKSKADLIRLRLEKVMSGNLGKGHNPTGLSSEESALWKFMLNSDTLRKELPKVHATLLHITRQMDEVYKDKDDPDRVKKLADLVDRRSKWLDKFSAPTTDLGKKLLKDFKERKAAAKVQIKQLVDSEAIDI